MLYIDNFIHRSQWQENKKQLSHWPYNF